jgi:hypothetical protein
MKRTFIPLSPQERPRFSLGVIGFTFVLLTGRILQLTGLLVNRGSLGYILSLLYLLFPRFLV